MNVVGVLLGVLSFGSLAHGQTPTVSPTPTDVRLLTYSGDSEDDIIVTNPPGPWIGSCGEARFISNNPDGRVTPGVTLTYDRTFDLSQQELDEYAVIGTFLSDDQGIAKVNGHTVFQPYVNFGSCNQFMIDPSHFTCGENSAQFSVWDVHGIWYGALFKLQLIWRGPQGKPVSVKDPRNQHDKQGDPLNTFTGSPNMKATDFSYNRVGFPFRFERYYREGYTSSSAALGSDWSHSYDWTMIWTSDKQDGYFIFEGRNLHFHDLGGGVYSCVNDPSFRMERSGGPFDSGNALLNGLLQSGDVSECYRITALNGNRYYFNSYNNTLTPNISPGLGATDLYGNAVLLSYAIIPSSSGWVRRRLTSVRDAADTWHIDFQYSSVFPFLNRIIGVSNSVGDVLEFKWGVGAFGPSNPDPYAPVTQVVRKFGGLTSGLDAEYSYVSPTTVNDYSLTYKKDPLSSSGEKKAYFDRETSEGGRVIHLRNANGQIMYEYAYTELEGDGNQETVITGPNGHWEKDVYINSEWREKHFKLDGLDYVEYYEWGPAGMTRMVDGRGKVTVMEYDDFGNLTYRRDGENIEQSFEYDELGRMTKNVDGNNKTRQYYYDGGKSLTDIVEPLGKHTGFTYYPNGLLRSVEDANYHTTLYTYDNNGNLLSIQEPGGATTNFIFDSRSRLATKSDAKSQVTSYTWNEENQLTDVCPPGVPCTHFDYDAQGNKEYVTDARGVKTKYGYDSGCGCELTDVWEDALDPNYNYHTQYTYDALGNRTSVVDAKNQATTFIYNEQSLVWKSRDALNKGVTYTYDGALNRKTQTDGRGGMLISYDYYGNNRLKNIVFSDGTAAIGFAYDGNGNRTSMTDGSGTRSYIYDDLNRLRSAQVNSGAVQYTLTYTYDGVGNRKTMKSNLPGTNYEYGYSYQQDNLLKAVTYTGGGKSTVSEYWYDEMKNLDIMEYPNGLVADYQYDPVRHTLTGISNMDGDDNIVSSFTYTYDNVGNRDSMTDRVGRQDYAYDDVYRLTQVTYPDPLRGVKGWTYDAVGNRDHVKQGGVIVETAIYNSGNEITSGYGKAFAHDAVGNMTQNGDNTYHWDALNRLIRVDTPNGTISYVYNGDNQRVMKTTATSTTHYVFDGLSVVAELNATGTVTKAYNPGISYTDDQGSAFYYMYDGLGSVVNLVDEDQNIVQAYTYTPWGQAEGVEKDFNSSRFVGAYAVSADDDTGLQYMLNRWHNPNIGRFISRDAMPGFAVKPSSLHAYSYCLSNPINYVDPTGLSPFLDCIKRNIDQTNHEIESLPYGIGKVAHYALGYPVGEELSRITGIATIYELAKKAIDSRAAYYVGSFEIPAIASGLTPGIVTLAAVQLAAEVIIVDVALRAGILIGSAASCAGDVNVGSGH